MAVAAFGTAVIYGMAVGSWLILFSYKFWLLLVLGTVSATIGDVLRNGASIGTGCGCGQDEDAAHPAAH